MKPDAKRDQKVEEDFLRATGVSLEKVLTLYQRAVENDWRTVQQMAQQAMSKYTASMSTAAEAANLLRLSRAILANENGKHLELSGLGDPAPDRA